MKKIWTYLVFAIMLISGLFFVPKLSENFDVMWERWILQGNIKEYAEAIGDTGKVAYYDGMGIEGIAGSIEKDHGISAYYLLTPILEMDGGDAHSQLMIWYGFTFLIFFMGTVFFYLIMQKLFKRRGFSMLMTLLYFTAPRMFIDGAYNNKDMVFLSLLVAVIYFGMRVIEERKWRTVIPFVVFSAMVCNTKILGFYFVGVIGLMWLIKILMEKKLSRREILWMAGTVGMMALLYVLITPAIWGNGFHLVAFFKYCLENAVSFRSSPTVLFEGVKYTNPENPLPWYYIPKLMLITLPIVSSVAFWIGLGRTVKDCAKKQPKLEIVMVILMMVAPLFTVIFKKPVLYNGWRHFYFLYGPLMIVAAYGADYVHERQGVKKNLAYGAIGVAVAINVGYIAVGGVANMAYFNVLAGRGNLQTQYELDYYNVTSKQAVNEFIKFEGSGEVYLTGEGFDRRIITDLLRSADEELKGKVKQVTMAEAKALTEQGEKVYYLSNPVFSAKDFSKAEKVYSYGYLGSEIINFYANFAEGD